ncbi:hypothetical protein [Pseudomonas sp.]|uniref:hypothetical protein n=1 Tax=Pseudomonas sp. TaxID=306 RepID=UPI0028AA7B32|nr:hypothetical protein [Pseudomonas sp.]
MLAQRLESPSLHDLQTTIAEHLASTEAELVVQFSAPEQYPAPILAALDALCATHGPRLEVRFWGHFAGQPFDGRTLASLPHVQVLSLDCLYQVENLERLGDLTQLHSLALGMDRLDLNPVLALDNLHTLRSLRVAQEIGTKLDLHPVSRLPHLQALHLNAKTTGLAPLQALQGLTALSLYRQPASTTFEVVASLPDLRDLAIGFGSREGMPELSSQSTTHLHLCRARGLQGLDLAQFPRVQVLQIEDQPHIASLDLTPCRQLHALRLENLKTLARLDGTHEVSLRKLSIYKTPALDLLALLDPPPPSLQAARLISGKRGLDQPLEARRRALGLAGIDGMFG